MDDLYCNGEEKQLAQCLFRGWGLNDCRPSEAAGVICDLSADLVSTTPSSPKIKRPIYVSKNISTGYIIKLKVILFWFIG